jgi:hypothetical protein
MLVHGDNHFVVPESQLMRTVSMEVAVGTIIADRPPHRSVRALIGAYGSYLG